MPTFSPRLTEPLNLDQAAGSSCIELSAVQVLRLRTNPWQVHEAKYFPPTKVTYSHTEFHNGQASYFSMMVLYLQNLDICNSFQTTANMSYDQKYCPFSDHHRRLQAQAYLGIPGHCPDYFEPCVLISRGLDMKTCGHQHIAYACTDIRVAYSVVTKSNVA